MDLLLLPGLNNTAAVFDEVIAHLPQGVSARAIDLPPLATVEALADEVLAQAPQRFWLAGFSFGGYVAMAVLERAPERVLGIGLVCSSPRADTPEQRAKRLEAIASAERGDYETTASTSKAPFHPDSLQRPQLLERRRAIVRAYGAQRYIAHVRATMERPDRMHLLDGCRPTLWVGASHDVVVPTAKQEADAARVPGCAFVRIEGAGHLLPLEQPAALAKVLASWVQEARAS